MPVVTLQTKNYAILIMPDRFTIKPLLPEQVAQAFPVVHTARPNLTLDRWVDYAGELAAGKTQAVANGIMTLQNDQGYIHGLFTYRVDQDLEHGRTLLAENVVVLGLTEQAAATVALIEAVEDLARRHDCGAIHTQLIGATAGPIADHSIVNFFRDSGHQFGGLRMCKTVDT